MIDDKKSTDPFEAMDAEFKRLRDENARLEVLVYDYADVLVPMLARMYKKRLAGYSALGYTVAKDKAR
jgi:predicted site-specific integrase-resolvase